MIHSLIAEGYFGYTCDVKPMNNDHEQWADQASEQAKYNTLLQAYRSACVRSTGDREIMPIMVLVPNSDGLIIMYATYMRDSRRGK